MSHWLPNVAVLRLIMSEWQGYFLKIQILMIQNTLKKSESGGLGGARGLVLFKAPSPLIPTYTSGESEVQPGLGISVWSLNWRAIQENEFQCAAFTHCKKCDHTVVTCDLPTSSQGDRARITTSFRWAESPGPRNQVTPVSQYSAVILLQVVGMWLELGPLDSHSRALLSAPTG